MRLVDLTVRNVRSYEEATVRFAPGITLLAGDIGAGKSSLLHAIEFALFGISRGELAGQGLLRHGTTQGEVRLTFDIDHKRCTVCRTLRKGKSGVAQDTGWLEIDGQRESLTAQELRARVFELLGYPLQFLAKQRNLIYRATVYTPQEEMKAILVDDPEDRVETVRRLFGLDAYRIARENAQHVMRSLKEREESSHETAERIARDATASKERLALAQEVILQRASHEKARDAARAMQEAAETQRHEVEERRAALMAARTAIAMAQRQRQVLQQQAQQQEQALFAKRQAHAQAASILEQTRERLAAVPHAQQPPEDLQAQEVDARERIGELRQQEGKLSHILVECAHGPGVVAGAPCPTCHQIVGAQHLDAVRDALASKASAATARLARVRSQIAAQEIARNAIVASLDRDRQRTQLAERERALAQAASGLAQDVMQAEAALARTAADLAALSSAGDPATIDGQLAAIERELAASVQHARNASSALVEAERALARADAAQDALVAERERLLALEAEHAGIAAREQRDALVRSWLAQRFIPLSEAIERQVLLSVHSTLDGAFRSLMGQLIEDDALSARLDGAFTPLVTQDGYETDVSYLSGGERTAVALAYRLALVRAVHALLPHLGTAGVVLLDEPTDGFSREQLERVTQVLRSVGAQQLLIVSHEQQLEGFVDRVVRIVRTGEGSAVRAAVAVS